MGLTDFILKCEEDNKELRKDIEYYKNYNQRLSKENQELKKQLEDIFNEYINYMDKQDFAKKCNISRPYLDKLLKSGMTRNEIHDYCLIRNKVKGSGINEYMRM